jgi:enediyne biosynthesis protein E4
MKHRSKRANLMLLPLLAIAAVGITLSSCGSKSEPKELVPITLSSNHENNEPYDGPPWFEDVTATTGINFTYRNDEQAGHFAIIETLGGGIGLIDFDNDGLLDIFVVGGGYYDGKKVLGHPCRMYKNLGNWKFKDVTAELGLDKPIGYTHGVAVADINRDGFPDLLVTGYDRQTLYLNQPDGKGGRKFVDVTAKSGLTERLWSIGAAFADLDGDGYPDLYLSQYCDWGFDTNHPPFCAYDGSTRDVCPPKLFKALPHKIMRNRGDGTFEDISDSLKLRQDGRGLGVIIADLNGDGRPDIYAANDTDPNFLYLNRGKPGEPIQFEECGGIAGAALDNRGNANGSMGLEIGDPLRSGKPAIFVSNFAGDLHALYTNQSEPGKDSIRFDYESHKNGLNLLGHSMVGWGTAFCDLDRDGWEDLVVVHGHVLRYPSAAAGRTQFAKILINEKGNFTRASNRGGAYFKVRHDARGMAMGDLDNDGKPDFVISHLNEPVVVLRNIVPTDNHWLGIEAAGEKFRDVVGGKIVVKAGGETYTRYVKSGGSYASANDPRYVIGIAGANKVDSVTVHWPNGKVQEWGDLAIDRYWKLTEGQQAAK